MQEQEKKAVRLDTCDFRGVQPIMMALPYPPVQVAGKNSEYAELLKFDYCGSVSEMSAITQYINNENRLSCGKCSLAKVILVIAMAVRQRGGKRQLWTPEYLKTPENARNMVLADIESEKAAINQYRMHMRRIRDPYVNAVLARIIRDEEYHIMTLQALL